MQATAVAIEENYLTEKQGLLSWFFTTDHKRIAILYTASVTLFFMLGGLFALQNLWFRARHTCSRGWACWRLLC